MPFVLDASVALSWCFRDEQTAYSLAVLARLEHEEAVVPSLWALEVANGLLVAERRNRVTTAELSGLLVALGDIAVTLREAEREDVLGRVLDLARAHGLSVYDAAYLDVAMREGLPLATEDQDLIGAAQRAGVARLPA